MTLQGRHFDQSLWFACFDPGCVEVQCSCLFFAREFESHLKLHAVLLAAYIAVGAPLAKYVPGLRELTFVEPKEKPLTQAEIERREREALRKEQEEEFEATLLEDRIKEAEEKATQDKIDAARHEKEEAENAKQSILSAFTQHVESARERLAAVAQEPEEGVLLRLRCPDGLQLTRKFAKDSPVQDLYDFVDVERYNKAAKVRSCVLVGY